MTASAPYFAPGKELGLIESPIDPLLNLSDHGVCLFLSDSLVSDGIVEPSLIPGDRFVDDGLHVDTTVRCERRNRVVLVHLVDQLTLRQVHLIGDLLDHLAATGEVSECRRSPHYQNRCRRQSTYHHTSSQFPEPHRHHLRF